MSILRGPRPEANFYVLDKQIAADPRLSWAARGLLIFLLTKPDSWRVSVEHLRKQTDAARIRTGRNGIYALLQELQAAGYVETQQPRTTDGKLAPVEYVVREKPHPSDRDAVPRPSEPLAAERTQVRTERAARTEDKSKANARSRTYGWSRDQAREWKIQQRTEAKRDRAEADAQWALENLPSCLQNMVGPS